MSFDFSTCTPEDRETARRYIGSLDRAPDLVITTDDNKPYLHRWHVVPRAAGETIAGNVYFHIQTSSDPERPLHDHPWDNMTLVLAGGYIELLQQEVPRGHVYHHRRNVGATVFRQAKWAHRLVLPPEVPYTMTQFVTGRYERKWGFWIGRTWYPHDACAQTYPDGRAIFRYPPGTEHFSKERELEHN